MSRGSEIGQVVDTGFQYLNHKYRVDELRAGIRRVWNFIVGFWKLVKTPISAKSNNSLVFPLQLIVLLSTSF